MQRPTNSIHAWRLPNLQVELGHGRNVAHSYPRHWHEDFHLSLITERAGRLECRGRSLHAPTGSLSLVPPGEVHANPCEPAGCSFRNMYIHPMLVEEAAAQVTGLTPFFPDFRERLILDSKMSRSFVRLHRALEGPASRLDEEGMLFNFLRELILRHAHPCPVAPQVGPEFSAVRRARDFIVGHHAESISLASLASLTGLSPFHLNHAFCRDIGMPPHAFQIQVRIARAKRLLSRPVSISQVALVTGFADQSHFARHFRRLTGMTPAQYAARPQERSRPVPAA